MAALVTAMAPINSVLSLAQAAMLAAKPPPPTADPIFVLGHWRSGTTLLHELLALDGRFTFPTAYACFAPAHFLVSEHVLGPIVGLVTPRRRPQDEMSAGLGQPQEDEFATMALGAPSPYSMFAFPEDAEAALAHVDFEGFEEASVLRWVASLRRFLACLAWRRAVPAILKSPAHTARLALLADAFPASRFALIVRDPRRVIPSTRHMIEAMIWAFGFDLPDPKRIRALAFALHERLYRRLAAEEGRIASGRLHTIRYEDLVADPVGIMRGLYTALALGGFDDVAPAIDRYFKAHSGFRSRRHDLTDEDRGEIEARCADMMRRYGYAGPA